MRPHSDTTLMASSLLLPTVTVKLMVLSVSSGAQWRGAPSLGGGLLSHPELGMWCVMGDSGPV